MNSLLALSQKDEMLQQNIQTITQYIIFLLCEQPSIEEHYQSTNSKMLSTNKPVRQALTKLINSSMGFQLKPTCTIPKAFPSSPTPLSNIFYYIHTQEDNYKAKHNKCVLPQLKLLRNNKQRDREAWIYKGLLPLQQQKSKLSC